MTTQTTDNKNFYLKVFLISFGIISVIYSFMIFQFWWGNHEWNFLKDGISLKDGFFEARYSQHLLSVLLFDGQILPPIIFVTAFALLALFGITIAKYLQIPQRTHYYILFTLLLTIPPHTPILFYYVFIILPLIFWGYLGTSLLFLSHPPYKLWKLLLGSLGFFFLLGGYPPVLALILTLFIAKQLHLNLAKKQNFIQCINTSFFFLGQLILAYIGHKITTAYLIKIGTLNPQMYNISLRELTEIIQQIPTEIIAPITQLKEIYTSLGLTYTSFYFIILICALWQIFYLSSNKPLSFIFIITLFVASRLSFLISEKAYEATFRVSWWGNTGLIAACLSFLMLNNKTYIRNIFLCLSIFFLCIFIKTDYSIQKVQYLAFHSERLFQKRVEERLFSYPEFDINKSYLTLNLGYPDFHRHFCYKNCRGFNNALLDSTVLPADFGTVMFWDEQKNPVSARFGYWNERIYFVTVSYTPPLSQLINNDQIISSREWAYLKAKGYPDNDSIFLNNNLMILDFDHSYFTKKREKALKDIQNLLLQKK